MASPRGPSRGVTVRGEAQPRPTSSRLLTVVAVAAFAVGLGLWAFGVVAGMLVPGIFALWAFSAGAVALAFGLPLPYALVSPLFAGVAGWLVDMLPFVILVGWAAVVVRWARSLWIERRFVRGGRWVWLPIALVAWTGAGVLVIDGSDFKHFLLLLGIQVVASGVVLAVVDSASSLRARTQLVTGLVVFIVLLSGAVFLQWIGINIQGLQDRDPRRRVEAAYGVDAFPNNIGMIKYARSIKAGALELRRELDAIRAQDPAVPAFEVFRPRFQAYENSLVVRFDGSAREFADLLAPHGIELLFDNVGLAPANTVPRLRSFPRNALTFAGACAAVLPLALFLAWTTDGRRRLLGRVGVAACLFGAGFSLARGAWVAIAIGILYLVVDGLVSGRRKLQAVGAVLIAALVLTGVFLVKYGVDPLNGRAGGGASVQTRSELYDETLDFITGVHLVLGYGTERPRTDTGTVREGTRYVPRAGTHSTYLNYLFRTGLPGALGIAALYGIAAFRSRRRARAAQGRERVLSSLTSAAVVVAAAHAVILSLYVEPIYTLTVSLVLGIAAAGVLPHKASPSTVVP